jgi:hypothetical protein
MRGVKSLQNKIFVFPQIEGIWRGGEGKMIYYYNLNYIDIIVLIINLKCQNYPFSFFVNVITEFFVNVILYC